MFIGSEFISELADLSKKIWHKQAGMALLAALTIPVGELRARPASHSLDGDFRDILKFYMPGKSDAMEA